MKHGLLERYVWLGERYATPIRTGGLRYLKESRRQHTSSPKDVKMPSMFALPLPEHDHYVERCVVRDLDWNLCINLSGGRWSVVDSNNKTPGWV